MKALSVGLPGRLKSSVTSCREGPEIEFPADELGTVVEPNGLRIAELACGLLERRDDISAAIGRANVDRWRQAREGIDDGQHADLAPSNS